MRLIDKMALCDELIRWRNSRIDDAIDAEYNAILKALEIVGSAPTVDAEPVRHGEWNGWTATHWTGKKDDNGDPIYAEHTYYKCSECGRRTVIREKFCPNCGAKMDGERKDDEQID